ncbi:DinB family protein [Arcticibacterium luteifluviistationis]|uniref:Damage-inducible protein DinB n=1 Tax=Arcticibacterium luteifluviistationis TaxID=1784714 RepID=A0A2Z4G9I2_9BACT|nr:DinB family protein [Arcticibacterium luteifluviistationis]AWV97871.1 damage-inducible protein DinB [Arcticibacterium luteifluviistationis]
MITFIEAFKKELADEVKETKRMLEKVPVDKYDWQPHPKSMKLGVLACHLAEIPDMIEKALLSDKWDFAEEEAWKPTVFKTNDELLAFFDNSVAKASAALEQSRDDLLQDKWKLCAGDITYLEMEKWEAVRHAFGQNSHHRAQLGVFLRLLDISIPGPYGPSADEM